MNGVGKTKFGKKLASRLHMKAVDSDSTFRKIYGNESEFIERKGWEVFRNIEQDLIVELLKPGHVIILGGGAIEATLVREALNHTTVIWMKAGIKRVTRHLKEAKRPRPEFHNINVKKRATELLEKRNPLYEEMASIIIDENIHFSQQVPVAIEKLKKQIQ